MVCRYAYAASVYGRALPELRQYVHQVLREAIGEEPELGWMEDRKKSREGRVRADEYLEYRGVYREDRSTVTIIP